MGSVRLELGFGRVRYRGSADMVSSNRGLRKVLTKIELQGCVCVRALALATRSIQHVHVHSLIEQRSNDRFRHQKMEYLTGTCRFLNIRWGYVSF